MENYSILDQLTNENNKSHAFLVKVDCINDKYEIVKSVKKIVCPNKCNNHGNCSICSRIENNTFSETIFLDNNKNALKKDEILDIQKRFSNKVLEGKKMVYIIENVQGVSPSVANTLLKFLEEPPSNDIVAIFTTTNLHKVLPTIKSRCQIIQSYQNNNIDNLFETVIMDYSAYESNALEELINLSILLIETYALKKSNIIAFLPNLIHEKVKDKKDYINIVNIMICIYTNIVEYKICNQKKIDNLNYEMFDIVNLQCIVNYISYLNSNKKYLELNANAKLFYDKIFIDMEKKNEHIH